MPERLDYRPEENSDAELLEDIQVEEENQLEIVPFEVNEHGHGCIEQSMAELLDGLQDKTTMARGSSKMVLCLHQTCFSHPFPFTFFLSPV